MASGEVDKSPHNEQPENHSVQFSILDNLLEGCQVVGFDWRYIYINPAATRQNRQPVDQQLGRTMMECYPGIEHAEFFPVMRRCMEERTPQQTLTEFTFPDGVKGWYDLRFEPMPQGTLILSLDVTEQRRMEDQLRQSQRLESIGRLAGGIAHDFNNLLTIINNYAGFALDALPNGNPLRTDLEEIAKAGERAALLTRQLLAFSRKQVLKPEIANLNTILSNIEGMLGRLIGEDVRLVIKSAHDLGLVLVDPGQVEQVIMNLAVNARDAMPGGGTLTIETANVYLDEEYSSRHIAVTPGPYVMLSVADTGCGMDAETQKRLFEPFYTTKEAGKGTGLGLAMVYGIVKQSGGNIWVYSEPGKGATFKIYFRREMLPGEVQAPRERSIARSKGGETIMVVEDDETVRAIAVRILKSAGYEVIEAGGGSEAILLASSYAGPIHLLLTDVIMAGLSGRELAARLTAARPGIRVLFMSGYTDNVIAHHGVLDAGIKFIEKPFNAVDLTAIVRETLDMS